MIRRSAFPPSAPLLRAAALAAVLAMAGAFSLPGRAEADTPSSVTDPSAPATELTWAAEQRAQAWARRQLDASPRERESVTIDTGGKLRRGYVIYPKNRPVGPVVIVLHEVYGLTDSTLATADDIAAMGHLVLVPDMLAGAAPDGGGTPDFPTIAQTTATLRTMRDGEINTVLNDWATFGQKLDADARGFAIVGLGWGGGAAFRYATDPDHDKALELVAVFSHVGPPVETQGPPQARAAKLAVDAVDVPVYGFYGSNDTDAVQSLPATEAAMKADGKTFVVRLYERADHDFMRLGGNPESGNPANAGARQDALVKLQELLAPH